MESANEFEGVSRRTLIKLMALASPVPFGLSGLLAQVNHPASREVFAHKSGSKHPRLFYNSASLRGLQRMLSSDGKANGDLKRRGEELLAAEWISENVAEIGGGQQANYALPANQVADMGLTLGLLFHLTGEKRYAEKLRKALLYYGGYARWAGPGLAERVPPWHSVLETTLFSLGYAAGYDALRESVSETDRKAIAEIMVRLAVEPILNDWILPGRRIHSLDSMGHNWWGVCVAGAGLCGLALLDDDARAQSWIDAVDEGYVQWFQYDGNILQNRMRTFEPSGPSYEGVNYTNYGVSQYLVYRFAWQNTFPQKRARRPKPLEHLASFFFETLYPTSSGSLSVNFEDAPLSVDATETLLLLCACGFSTPDAARYFQRVRTASEGTLLTLLREVPRPSAEGDAPTSYIYPHMGWAVMRSSWKDNAVFLAMKSGYTWNHAHADAGTFVLFKQGVPLIIDSGTCKYSRPEYGTYYRLSQAHNVILFNGEGQPKEDIGVGCKFPGHVHSLIDGHALKYVYADATGPMARWFTRNYRHWIWTDDLIVIVDDVKAHVEGKMDWLLHFAGTYTGDVERGVRLQNGPAEAVVRMLYPGLDLREETGLADHDPDRKIPYLSFRTKSESRSQQFITAICLAPEAPPKLEVIEERDYLGLRIQKHNSVEELYFNLRAVNSPGTIDMQVGDWTTDAYLLHLTRSSAGAAVERYFIGDGSYLRNGSRSCMESLSKVTACWSAVNPLQIFTDGGSASLQLGLMERPVQTSWNGVEVRASFDSKTNLLSLRHPIFHDTPCDPKNL